MTERHNWKVGNPADSEFLRRYMELPRHLCADVDAGELAKTLVSVCDEIGCGRLAVLTGRTVSRQAGERLVAKLPKAIATTLVEVPDNTRQTVSELASSDDLRSSEAVLAVGGGTVVDVAKAVCLELDRPVIVSPTMLSTDGISSPVSVLKSGADRIESLPARLPVAVLVDLELVGQAPLESFRAGLGDLLANRSAVADWNLAAEEGTDKTDDFAALLAYAASELVWKADLSSLKESSPSGVEPDLVIRLLQGLALSGLAMEIAGSSRPCSGAEHLISHSIDCLFPDTASHGEQVALGTLITTYLRGEDWRELRVTFESAGMGEAVSGFGLSVEDLVAVVAAAPDTRPGRFTILERTSLDRADLAPMLEEILSAS